MMTKPNTLIVESDEQDRAFIKQTLEDGSHATTAVTSVPVALDQLRDTPFDLVITALELEKGVTGFRVVRAVKWRWPNTPVIIVTETGTFEGARAAIDPGVDGHLQKPIEGPKLQHVVQRALERQEARGCNQGMSQVLRWRGLALDRDEGLLTLDGEPIELTPTESGLLRCLIENGHRVISPEELFEASRGRPPEDRDRGDDAIRWHIYNLRQKIEPHPQQPTYILNVYGLGYTLAGPNAPQSPPDRGLRRSRGGRDYTLTIPT